MPFKPNYRLQRADRQRSKEQKQQKKLERRAEKNARRGAAALADESDTAMAPAGAAPADVD